MAARAENVGLSSAPPPAPGGWRRHAAPARTTLHNGFFLDNARGWLIAHQSGQIMRTVDGGASWQSVAELGAGFLESIYFVDAERGFLAGDGGRLLATKDGGATWRPGVPAEAHVAFYGLCFFSPEHGFAGGFDVAQKRGRLFETRDGGGSWSDRSSSLTGAGFTDAVAALGPAGALVGGVGVVYGTDDEGATWAARDVGARRPVRGLFVGPRRAWAVGAKGFVATSTDGGRAWSATLPFTDALLRSVLFLDDREGVAAGDRNDDGVSLWRTLDGGLSWRPDPGVAVGVHRLLRGAGRLWALGDEGLLLSRAL